MYDHFSLFRIRSFQFSFEPRPSKSRMLMQFGKYDGISVQWKDPVSATRLWSCLEYLAEKLKNEDVNVPY